MKKLRNGSILRGSSPLLIRDRHVFLFQVGFLLGTPPELPRLTPAEFPRETPPEVSLETPLYVPLEKTPPEFPRETPPVTPRDVTRETPHKQLHHRGPGLTENGFSPYGSCGLRTSRSSKTKIAVAQLKMKKLQEEQRLKSMERELEKQRLQLEVERQLLNARVEVE